MCSTHVYVGMLTDRSAGNGEDPGLTVENATAFLQHAKGTAPPDAQILSNAKLQYLMSRIIPYFKEIPGTAPYFAAVRKQLLSIISSPTTTTNGWWSHFFTEAMPDMYLPELYDNCISSANPLITGHATVDHGDFDARIASSNALSWSERCEILRDHPVIAARMHELQLDAFFDKIVKGRNKPFGEVLDWWIRVEFQGKGTAHSHWLLNTLRDSLDKDRVGDMDVGDPEVLARLLELCLKSSTARLEPRRADDTSDLSADPNEHEFEREKEAEYDFNIKRKQYFKDDAVCHPCRQRFRCDVDYSRDGLTGEIIDPYVQTQYRRLSLHNHMHICRGSCFKYCLPGVYVCRYCFPKEKLDNNEFKPVLKIDRDWKNRMRIKVLPPRTNGHLNATPVDTLTMLALRGNTDYQCLTNTAGCVEYSSKYISKIDAAESTIVQNLISRELSNHILSLPPHERPTRGKQVRAIINAIIQAQQIGSVQAAYVCMKLSFVRSSRPVENVQTLVRNEIDTENIEINEYVLSQLDADDSAISNSPTTTFGRRYAFHNLYLAQLEKFEEVEFDFFAFLTSYTVKKVKLHEKGPMKASELPQLTVDDAGLITNAKSCCIDEVCTRVFKAYAPHRQIHIKMFNHLHMRVQVYYSARRKHAVLKLVPHIPAAEVTERSAYSILLLHSDWGFEGEEGLLGNCDNAQVRLSEVFTTLPAYVQRNLDRTKVSEAHLDNAGEPAEVDEEVDEEDFDAYAAESFENLAVDDDFDEEPSELQLSLPNVPVGTPLSTTSTMLVNTPVSQMAFLNNFVHNMKLKSALASSNTNRLTEAQVIHRIENPSTHFDIENVDEEHDMVQKMIESCNERQADVVHCARQHIEGTIPTQMIMFLSGEGGTGKSHVIKILSMLTRIFHGKQQGRMGAVCLAAPTGGSAHNIGGMTWHSATGKSTFTKFMGSEAITPRSVNKLRVDFKGTQLLVLDEISLLCLEDVNEVDVRLQLAFDNPAPFGGIHVLFAGDLYQMRCISGMPVYTDTEKWTIKQKQCYRHALAGRRMFTTFLTHFKMLTTNVRAQSTEGQINLFAEGVSKIRLGDTSGDVLELFNSRLTLGMQEAMRVAHPLAIWIAATHKVIASINEAFARKLTAEGGTIVRLIADHVGKNATIAKPDVATRNQLYSMRGDPKGGVRGLSLSYIDVQIGTRVRITKNMSVQHGLFTGSMGTIHGFVYQGNGPDPNNLVPSNFAELEYSERELPIILVRMDGIDNDADPSKSTFPNSCSNQTTRLIPITAEPSVTKLKGRYHRMMYPLMVAHARTGHSIQGQTAMHGAVICTGSQFFAGEYTAISRAKRLDQIWLLNPLTVEQVTLHPKQRSQIEVEYARLIALFPFTPTELPLP